MKRKTQEITNDHKKLVLKITNDLYEKHKDKIFKQVPKYRDPESGMCLRDFIQLGLNSDESTEADKERFRNYLNFTAIDETEEVVDEKERIIYEDLLDKEIISEVKKRNLPKIILKNTNAKNTRNSTKINK